MNCRFAIPSTLALFLIAFGLSPIYVVAQEPESADTTVNSDEKDKNEDLPLEPGRTLHLQTNEGSWISVDVSPDGSTLVFDLLGDLYVLPIGGGVASQITSGMAFDSQPRFSPDGSKVLYISDHNGGENLWTIDVATQKTEMLTKGRDYRYESPEWTPDGRYVVASRNDGRFNPVQLWMMHVDGGSGKVLMPEPKSLRTTGAAPTPDGRYIWFAERSGSWQYNAMLPQYQLGIYDRDTGKHYTRSSRFGSAFRPTISPDGAWLVYGTRHEQHTGLRLRHLESGEERWLAYPIQRDDQESLASRDVLPGMSFTPDSDNLVASFGGRLWLIPIAEGPAQEIPFSVDTELEIGPEVEFDYPIEDTPTFTVQQIRDPRPSPDGSRLAFTSLDQVYVMDLPDGEPYRLTESENVEAQPTWAPDGEWIAYVSWASDGGHIHKVRANGRSHVQLSTEPALYRDPMWSPDGERIVAIRGPRQQHREATGQQTPNATYDIVWISAEGGDINVIAPSDNRSSPHFTHSSDRIYLFSTEKGLVSIRWDGTDEKEHVKVTGNKRPGQEKPNQPKLILMAPKGDLALAYVNNDLYTVTVPYVGGETPTISVSSPSSASFPARKLTRIGGQFPAWADDGRTAHWSLGNAFFTYDLDAAETFEDSLGAVKAENSDEDDSESDEPDEEKDEEPSYQPAEIRVLIEAERDIPKGTVLFQGARIITMDGDRVIESGDILVQDNRIVAVGQSGTLDSPSNAHVIDVTGRTIVPGFVDTHAHLRPMFEIHRNLVWQYLANLAYGVTTTRDPQTGSTDVLTYADRVTSGDLIGPRIYSTGVGLFGDYVNDPIRDLDHARDIMKRYSEYYDTKTIKMYMSGNRQQRQWIIMAAREQGITPTTEGGLDLQYDITMMIDGYPGQEHNLPIFPLYQDVVQLAAQTGISYTPTLVVSFGGPFGENYFFTRENPHDDPKVRRFTPHAALDAITRRRGQGAGPGPGGWFMDEEHVFREHARTAKAIVEAGGRVCVGSHGQLQGLGYHWELWALQSGGMSEHDALRAATIFGAEAIGMSSSLGSLEVGKLADMVVLEENPLEDIRNTNTVDLVVMNGRVFDGDTLDEIWPRQITRGAIYQDDPPDDLESGLDR